MPDHPQPRARRGRVGRRAGRREPRYGRFIALGAVVGVLAAVVVVVLLDDGEGRALVLGWLAVALGALGALLAALVAVLVAPRR